MSEHDIIVIADYLSVMVKGPLSAPEFEKITDDILAECKSTGLRKVIIDVSDTGGPFSEEDKLAFASYASSTLKDHVDQYAYIYPKALITYTPQVIAQGSGFNVRGFTNLDDALVWMKEDLPGDSN